MERPENYTLPWQVYVTWKQPRMKAYYEYPEKMIQQCFEVDICLLVCQLGETAAVCGPGLDDYTCINLAYEFI